MGVYLSKANTDLHLDEGGGHGVRFAAGEIQGWRKSMEDAHVCEAHADWQLYCVFDGHGGKEVAKFAQSKFAAALTSTEEFARGEYERALRETFHKIDDMLEEPRFSELLQRYKLMPNPSDLSVEEKERLKKQAGSGGEAAASSSERESESSNSSLQAKTKLTKAQAVELFKKLLVAEREAKMRTKKKNNGEEETAPSAASSSTVAATLKPAAVHTPPSIRGPDGITCNLADHRINAGCTAVVALIAGNNTLYVANAGDSRGVLCRGDGSAYALSEDHKPESELEKGRIEAAGGFVNAAGRVNGNLNLSRSLGDLKYKQVHGVSREGQIITAEPDVTVTPIRPTDRFFILACDGIWDVMTNQVACDFVSERLDRGLPLSTIISEVFEHCVAEDPKKSAGIGGDNMTFLCVLLNQEQE